MTTPAAAGAALAALLGALAASAFALVHRGFLDQLPLALLLFAVVPAVAGAITASALRRPIWSRRRARCCGLGALLILLLLRAIAAGLAPIAPPRLLLIGFDGASPAAIASLTKRGQLPAFAGLLRDGTWGPLRSFEPSASPRIWSSIMTGTRPSVHRVLDWTTRQAALRAPRLWDALEARGWSVGLYRMIVTWPPQPLNGFVIPGWLAPSGETWPAAHEWLGVLRTGIKPAGAPRRPIDYLRYAGMAIRDGATLSQLHAIGRWWIELKLFRLPEQEQRLRAAMLWARLDPDFFLALLERRPARLAVYYTDVLDKLSHVYWSEQAITGDSEPAERIRQGYREVDAGLARLLARAAGPRTVVAIVSDHGFRADPTASAPASLSGTLLIRAFDLDPRIRALHPFEGVELYVDADEGSTAALLAQAAARLATVRCIETNGPAFAVELLDLPGSGDDLLTVRLAAAVQNGGFPLADLKLSLEGGRRLRLGDLLLAKRRSPGTHDPFGILILRGPGIRAGARLEGASVIDVVPTLLAAIDEPLWPRLQGRVLESAFAPGHRSAHPVRVGRMDGYPLKLAPGSPVRVDDRRLDQQLRALGYLR